MQTWTWASSRFPVLRVRTSACAGPGKRPWQNRQSCQPIEQVLGHPLFFLRLPSNAFPDIGKANTHGKTKAILFLLWSIWFCREVFGFAVRYFVFAVRFLVLPWGILFLPWCFCFCREVFGFAVTVVGHHSFVLSVAWSTEKKGKNNSAGRSARTCVTFGQMTSLVCDAHSQQNWQTTGGRCPRWLKKTFFWQLHQMRFGILFIQKTGIKRKSHRSVY